MTRAAFVVDDVITHIWLGPGHDEEAEFLVFEQNYYGKVISIDHNLKAAFINLGAGHHAFVDIRHSTHNLSEGQLVGVRLKKMAIGSKYPVGEIIELGTQHNPFNDKELNPIEAPIVMVCQAYSGLTRQIDKTVPIDEIIMSSGEEKNQLLAYLSKQDIHAPKINIDDKRLGQLDFEQEITDALMPEISLPSGGRLNFHETEALTAIDIDSGAMQANSGDRMRERVNREAVLSIVAAITLRQIRAQIVIDFLPMKKAVQGKFDGWMRRQFEKLPGFSRAGWLPSGIFGFVLPRSQPSLLSQLSVAQKTDIIDGRGFSPDYLARRAVMRCEDKLRTHPSTRLTHNVSHSIFHIIDAHPHWQAGLDKIYGARSTIALSADLLDDQTQTYEQ